MLLLYSSADTGDQDLPIKKERVAQLQFHEQQHTPAS